MANANNIAPLPATANVLDVSSLATLKRQAGRGDPAANKEVARQFEAFFLQMVMKSMREATPREGVFDSDQTRMYESLLDQQLAQVLGGGNRGTGLAAMIEAQLARQNQDPRPLHGPFPLQVDAPAFSVSREHALPLQRDAAPAFVPLQNLPLAPAAPVPPTTAPVSGSATTQRAFVDRILPAAVAAERMTGIPAHFMVAQAALETGWGKFEPRRADGSSSFNIFGIKAGANWRGATVEATTTEVIAGLAQTRVERFRAYGSYDEAVGDYASLLVSNPRYAAILGAQEPDRFARGLQTAGYATDPQYAAKLESIIGGATLRQALAGWTA
ncbi:MAG: flagellar assembly peptidoglycan hydrolase FlgJ [Sulfuritalea sp.]|jgi:flagellar protein FlgJ|nr:flagellar assembly peptidoglycan hydrolase FlgJ [Azonexus sp.]MCC7310390.1 flagellar assembly peptidoglycan hydrolase FlgJ [Sulfuritalea sp.]